MGKSPDKIVADIDAAQNKEDLELPKRVAKAAVNLVKPKATKPDTGETTNPMGDKYSKGGKVMKKKMKRYEEGGDVETETAQGQNKNIGDDVRARAMAAIAAGGVKDEEPAKPNRKKVFKPKTNAATESHSRMNAMGDTYRKGGKVTSASKRADGCAIRGKTRA